MFAAKASAGTAASDTPAQQKSTYDMLLTTTPVVMTVVATLLAGLSSSEMTQAQYHRSLAAQNQSKVGDQWAFFQAKRIRGTTNEMTAKLLPAAPAEVTVDFLQTASAGLVHDLQQCARAAQDLATKVTSAKSDLGPSGDRLQQITERFARAVQEKTKKAEKLQDDLSRKLAEDDVQKAFAYLNTDAVPRAADGPKADQDPLIMEALAAIARRKTEKETESIVAPITEAVLRQAITEAENKAQAFDDACKPVNTILAQLGKLVNEEAGLARSVYLASRELDLGEVPENKTGDVRAALTSLRESALSLRDDARELKDDYQALQLHFNARRYEREARDNQAAAGLYEIQVRKSGWNSDRHRTRSKYFFYGMLAAQAGVTIASLALAVRLKSVLWGIAGAAGILALLIGGYVYLFV